MIAFGQGLGCVFLAFVGVGVGWGLGGLGGGPLNGEVRNGAKSELRTANGPRGRGAPGVRDKVGRVAGQGGMAGQMKAAYALAMSVPLDRIEEWLDKGYFQTADSQVDGFFRRVLYDRYLDADPEGFLGWCVRKEVGRDITRRYMNEWVSRDVGAAREFLSDLKGREAYSSLAPIVLEQMAESDRGGALELLGELSMRMGSSGWDLNHGLWKLAQGDPEGVEAAAQDWAPGVRHFAMQQVGRAFLKRDFVEGIAWFEGQSQGQGGSMFAAAVGGDGGALGESLLEHVEQIPAGWLNEAMRRGGINLVRSDPAGWLALDGEVAGLDEGTASQMRRHALMWLVREDWDVAEGYLREGELSSGERSVLIGRLASGLAGRSREEAEAWVNGLSAAEDRAAAQRALASSSDRVARGAAVDRPSEIVLAVASGGNWGDAHRARRWTGAQAAEALVAFEDLAGEERVVVARRFIGYQYYLPMELSGAAVRTLMLAEAEGSATAGDLARRAASNLARQWTDADPAAAARWVEGLPAGEVRDEAAGLVYEAWRLQAPDEAERWGLGR